MHGEPQANRKTLRMGKCVAKVYHTPKLNRSVLMTQAVEMPQAHSPYLLSAASFFYFILFFFKYAWHV